MFVHLLRGIKINVQKIVAWNQPLACLVNYSLQYVYYVQYTYLRYVGVLYLIYRMSYCPRKIYQFNVSWWGNADIIVLHCYKLNISVGIYL